MLDLMLFRHLLEWRKPITNETVIRYVTMVNASYDDYIAAGGNDEHYNARFVRWNWNYNRLIERRAAATQG